MDKVKEYALWFLKSFIWLGVLLFVIDIVTKTVIVANHEYLESLPSNRIVLIPGFLGINYKINNSAAFGIGADNFLVNRIVYIVLASIASAVLIAVYVKYFKRLRKLYRACMMLILAGAIGNLIDRVFYTVEYEGIQALATGQPGVVDWIDFYGIWPYIFNIADSSIVIGTLMLIVVLIVEEVMESRNRNKVTLKKDVVEAKIKAQEEAKAEDTKIENNEEKADK